MSNRAKAIARSLTRVLGPFLAECLKAETLSVKISRDREVLPKLELIIWNIARWEAESFM